MMQIFLDLLHIRVESVVDNLADPLTLSLTIVQEKEEDSFTTGWGRAIFFIEKESTSLSMISG